MSVVFNSCAMSLFPKDSVLRTCLLYSTFVWCPCFQRIPYSDPVCYTLLLFVLLASKGSRSQNLSVILNVCVGSLLPKDPVRSTCLLYSTLMCGVLAAKEFRSQNLSVVFNSCVASLVPKDPVLKTYLLSSTIVWCPCFQRIPFSETVCYIQLLCGVLASKGSRSQNLSVIFNSCVVSWFPKDPVLRTCLLYSTLVWCPCIQRIPFSEPACYIQLLCGVLASKGSRSQNLSVVP